VSNAAAHFDAQVQRVGENRRASPSAGYIILKMELAGSSETVVVTLKLRVVRCQRMTCSFQLFSTKEALMFWPVLVARD